MAQATFDPGTSRSRVLCSTVAPHWLGRKRELNDYTQRWNCAPDFARISNPICLVKRTDCLTPSNWLVSVPTSTYSADLVADIMDIFGAPELVLSYAIKWRTSKNVNVKKWKFFTHIFRTIITESYSPTGIALFKHYHCIKTVFKSFDIT